LQSVTVDAAKFSLSEYYFIKREGMIFMSLGNRIKSLRKAQNLTQQKLADKVSVSRIYVQALESNRRLPSMKLLQKLAPALHVDVTDLLMDFSQPGKPGRVQLESMLDNGELEIWYRSRKLSQQELHRVYRVVEAALDDWDEKDEHARKK
jgi:transcriptional regulator with XRE-family HTH domain